MKDASTSSETVTESGPTLHRGLQNRHIQLIALGGAIGTGLFLGIGPAIQMAGPAVLLGYAVAGIVAFLIMRQLGEMVVEEPVSGSFAHFAYKYWGPFAGFLSGWNYWVMFVLVGMAELTAAGIYMQYWLPDVPTGFGRRLSSSLLTPSTGQRTLVWRSGVLVRADQGAGDYRHDCLRPVDAVRRPRRQQSRVRQSVETRRLPRHRLARTYSVAGGDHVLLRRAGAYRHHRRRSAKPGKSIPKAVNQVVYRILLFYIGSLVVLLALYPWVEIKSDSSPFVMIFHNLDSNWWPPR